MLGVVAEILGRRACEGWLVGGSVRDRLMGLSAPDLDIVVADDAAQVAREVAAEVRSPWFTLSERYPTFRVLGPEGHVDVTAVRGDSIYEDLAGRDFTVNAMAVPLAALAAGLSEVESLVDPFGGAVHLREGRLVAVSGHVFADDPLRLMRAPRFCHTRGLALDDDLAAMIRTQASGLSSSAPERVVTEMCLTLAEGRTAAAVKLWRELGLLQVFLPEAEDQGAGRRLLTLTPLERLDEMLERPSDWFPEEGARLETRLAEPVDGAVTRPVALRLAALLRAVGDQQVRAVGRRLRLSSSLTSLLSAVTRCAGGDPRGRSGVRQGGLTTLAGLLPDGMNASRSAVLFFWEGTPWEPETVMVAAAGEEGGTPDSRRAARRMMVLACERACTGPVPMPINGEVLMKELGVESGPRLGEALREAQLAWEAGEATTSGDLLAIAREQTKTD